MNKMVHFLHFLQGMRPNARIQRRILFGYMPRIGTGIFLALILSQPAFAIDCPKSIRAIGRFSRELGIEVGTLAKKTTVDGFHHGVQTTKDGYLDFRGWLSDGWKAVKKDPLVAEDMAWQAWGTLETPALHLGKIVLSMAGKVAGFQHALREPPAKLSDLTLFGFRLPREAETPAVRRGAERILGAWFWNDIFWTDIVRTVNRTYSPLVTVPVRAGEEFLRNNLKRWFFPGLLTQLHGPLDAVQAKVRKNPETLNDDDRALLATYGQLEGVESWLKFREEYPRLAQAAHAMETGARVGVRTTFQGVALLAATYAAYILSDDSHMPSTQEYLENKELGPEEDEIQLLVETYPLPHTAIRIGKSVYSYGVSHVMQCSPEEYLTQYEQQKIIETILELKKHKDELSPEEIKILDERFPGWDKVEVPVADDFSGKTMEWMTHVTGVKDWARAVDVITIKVGKEKARSAQRFFEDHVASRYENRTWVTDCNTHSLEPIGGANWLYDPSPSLSVGVLNARSALLSRLGISEDLPVTRSFTVMSAQVKNKKTTALRNAYMRYAESANYLSFAIFNAPKRRSLDVEKPIAERHSWDPFMLERFKVWEQRVPEELYREQMPRFLLGALARGEGSPEERKELFRLWKATVYDPVTKDGEKVQAATPPAAMYPLFMATRKAEFVARQMEVLRKEFPEQE